jgi:hypothetical protein
VLQVAAITAAVLVQMGNTAEPPDRAGLEPTRMFIRLTISEATKMDATTLMEPDGP